MSFAEHLAAADDVESFFHGLDAAFDEMQLYAIARVEAGDDWAGNFVTEMCEFLARRYEETAAALREPNLQNGPPQKKPESKVLFFMR